MAGFFKYVLVVGQKGIDPPECFSQEILMNNLKASLVDMFSPKVQKYVECEVVCLKDELQSDRTLRHCTRRRNPATAHSGCLDPKNILSTIDPPPGVPGVSKNHIFFSTNESVFLLR